MCARAWGWGWEGEKTCILVVLVAASQVSHGLGCQRYPEADGQVLELWES